jgi:uncharacterized protein (TIRG00374 family)
MSAARKSWFKTLAKIVFVVGLLYWLSQRGFISARETGRAFSDWGHSLPALAMMAVSTLLGAVRWQLLLRGQGIRLGSGRVLQLTLIGNFFNIALPGAVSGDFVKAFYVGKEVGGQRARSFGSILFDRVAGLSALVLISAGALLLGFGQFEGSRVMAGTRVFVVTGAACVLAFYGYLFLVREHHDPVLRGLRALGARMPKLHSLTEIYVGLRHYHHHRLIVLQVLAISVVIQLLVGLTCWHFAAALGETGIPLLALYVIVPLGLLVTAVPVAPAGVGTGHAAFLFLFGLLGCQRGADIFTLVALCNILFGAIGGVVYLRFRSHEPAPPPGADAAELGTAGA